jgi:hypothetical protein
VRHQIVESVLFDSVRFKKLAISKHRKKKKKKKKKEALLNFRQGIAFLKMHYFKS